MQVHRVLPTEKILENSALTVGSFDGVHKGHQSLISQLQAEAKTRGLQSVALTFEDLPYCFFRPDDCPKLLSLAEEKIEHFEQTGLNHLFIIPFTAEISTTNSADFMRLLAENVGLKLFMGGPDFALGKNREGTIPQLQELGKALGFEAKALDVKLPENGAPISSTRCRGVIEGGQVELARQFLNRTYKLGGTVVSGDQIGRKIGVPTINLQVEPRKCLPKNGVYAVYAHFDGKTFPAALNMGFRPTVGGLKHQIEFHVIDHEIETPPEKVEIEFIARLRDEQKFDGLEALVAQLQRDIVMARETL